MTDSTDESPASPERPKRHVDWQKVPGVNAVSTPVTHRFDPPLEHRPHEEIYAGVTADMKDIDKRRFGRKKVT
jgi:hypothetical protein